MAQDGKPENDPLPPDRDMIRTAYRIAMQDVDLETGVSTTIRADTVVEKMDHTVLLTDFAIDRGDRMHLTGARARYDIQKAQLELTGDIVVQTQDGMQGFLHSLTWDRASHRAWTNAPVRIITRDGIIAAKRAETFDDLEHISLVGGVNAKIAGDSLGGKLADSFGAPGS